MGAALGAAADGPAKPEDGDDVPLSGAFPEIMWEQNQDAVEETDSLVKEMEDAQLSKAALFRKGLTLIRRLADQKKYAEANKAFGELEPRIHGEYDKFQQSRSNGVRDLDEGKDSEGEDGDYAKGESTGDDKAAQLKGGVDIAPAPDGDPNAAKTPPAPAADPNAAQYQKQILKVGSKGPAVEYLQKSLGGSLKVDGKFGPGTQKAVKDFQTSKSLKADGIVGPKTWAAIGGGAAPAPAAAPPAGAGAATPAGAAPAGSEAAAPGAGSTGFISASVGKGGKNLPEDVKAVQEALNKVGGAKLSADGKYSSQTQKAIEEFQKRLGQFKPDGLIRPGRGPARILSGSEKMPPTPAEPKPIAPPELGTATLEKGAFVWNSTRDILETNIEELKKGVLAAYNTEHTALLKEIDGGLVKLRSILDKLDTRLADSLDSAYKAEGADRDAELKNSKSIMTDYIKFLKSDKLVKHMDDNPFGVDTSLQKIITNSLNHLAQLFKK